MKVFNVMVAMWLLGFMIPAGAMEEGMIQRGIDGKPVFVTYEVALNACPTGSRLPTARELAKLFLGSSKLAEVSDDQVPEGFSEVRTFESQTASIDHFATSNSGYTPRPGMMGELIFWTSSAYTKTDKAYAWSFDSVTGELSWNRYRADTLAVLCIN